MNEQPVIMVQVADPPWTWAALHSACTQALNCGGRIALVQTVCVRHPLYLGSQMGYLDLCERDIRSLQAYTETIAGYEVNCDVTVYQAWSLWGAVADAAELVAAEFVYAKPPASMIPFWSACQFELLRVRLARQHCELLSALPAPPQPLRPQTVAGFN